MLNKMITVQNILITRVTSVITNRAGNRRHLFLSQSLQVLAPGVVGVVGRVGFGSEEGWSTESWFSRKCAPKVQWSGRFSLCYWL